MPRLNRFALWRLNLRHDRHRFLVLAVISALLFVWLGMAPGTVAQEVTSIPNTATANFRDPTTGSLINVRSNSTVVTAASSSTGLEIVKTADRASAEPGDTVVFRLLIKNTGSLPLQNLEVTDTLPLGLKLVAGSARGALAPGGENVPGLPAPTMSGAVVKFTYPTLAPNQTLTIVYAALVSPDAIRGTGRNVAIAAGRTTLGTTVNSSTASYQVRIRPGILSDCGTVLGRVFVDKNFDGEQQPGEPGVPNAVIYMDDGNRVTTDANGLFSLAYVIAGYRTGTLDLTSLPGYTLAPNLYRIEANSSSRLVRLAPGGMARMNFAVTPSFGEGQK